MSHVVAPHLTESAAGRYRVLVAVAALFLGATFGFPWVTWREPVYHEPLRDPVGYYRGSEATVFDLAGFGARNLTAAGDTGSTIAWLMGLTGIIVLAALLWVWRSGWWWPLAIGVAGVAAWVVRLRLRLVPFDDGPSPTPAHTDVAAFGANVWQLALAAVLLLTLAAAALDQGPTPFREPFARAE